MFNVVASKPVRRSRPETSQAQIRRLKRQRALLLAPWAILLAPVAIPLLLWQRAKGRFAKPKNYVGTVGGNIVRVGEISRYLWCGATAQATAALTKIIDDNDAPDETRMEAACRLAERLHFDGRPQEAKTLLEREFALPLHSRALRERQILAAFLAMESVDPQRAGEHLATLGDRQDDTVVQLLLAATEKDDDARLQAINRVMQVLGLAKLRQLDPDQPLSLVNISCGPLPDAPTVGKVTVIMPVWNAEATIASALQSVLSQTYRDLSVIVVDDASTDRSADVAEAIAAGDPRVRVLRQPVNQGAYAARNLGLAAADGAFVTTHDADDWSHPERIARQVAVLADSPRVVGVLSDWVRMTPDLRLAPGWRLTPDPISMNFSSFLFRSHVAEEIGSWDNVRFGADSEFIARCSARYGANAVVTRDPRVPLAFGLESAGSLTRTKDSHVSTFFYGKRQVYAEAGAYLHRAGVFGAKAVDAKTRVLPTSFLPGGKPDVVPDTLLVGDCRNVSVVARMAYLLDDASGATTVEIGPSVGILHRPDFTHEPDGVSSTDPFCDAWFDLVSRQCVYPIAADGPQDVRCRIELLS